MESRDCLRPERTWQLKKTIICAVSVTDINSESGIGYPSSNSGLVTCIHFRINTLEQNKNIYQPPLLQRRVTLKGRLSSLVWGENQLKENPEFHTFVKAKGKHPTSFRKNAW